MFEVRFSNSLLHIINGTKYIFRNLEVRCRIR